MSTATSTELVLTSAQLFRQCCRIEDGWSDHYGALHTAAAYAGFEMPERYEIRGIWQHGCIGPWSETSPGVLLINSPKMQEWPSFVARQEQVDYLAGEGYHNTRAIGLPIAYAPACEAPRRENSLLVVPTHSLIGDQHEDRTPFNDYADRIAEIAPQFDRVTICVHPNCRVNGLWVDEFTARGFEVIFGAQTNDRNALQRVRALFEQFEYVTTNGWGSHVAYALAFGARLSIHGPEIKPNMDNFRKDVSWSINPQAMAEAVADTTLANRRSYLDRVYQLPRDGVLDPEWGRWLIGADCTLQPEELHAILSDIIKPLEPLWQHVQKQRQQIRAQARQLDRIGRRGDAVKLLMQMVSKAVEIRDPRIILETLNDAATDLSKWDPARAQALRVQAQNFAQQLQAKS